MFRNFRSSANANTLRFLLRQANVTNLNNTMPYSALRARANAYLVNKGKPALSMMSGANSVIRKVANTLANKNKVARQLANQAVAAANQATAVAVGNPTPQNIAAANQANAAANAASKAAVNGNASAAAVHSVNAQRAAGP
jgi:hypothetical protein